MTIIEAINTAIEQLEGVRLPIRDADNSNRVRTALLLLDALRESAEQQAAPDSHAGDCADENTEGSDET